MSKPQKENRRKELCTMKNVIKSLIFMGIIVLAGVCKPQPVKAILPSTQQELDKANAELVRVDKEMKAAFDYWDLCKQKLNQAIASGDEIAISNADFECKRSQTMVAWWSDQYFNALAYVDHAKQNAASEKRKEDYTNYVKKSAEVDVASAAFTQAKVQLQTAKDKLAQTQKNIADLQAALPTHPELQATLTARMAEIPALQTDIANKEVLVKAANDAFDAKTAELHALDTVYWTYGEHEVYTTYATPFYPPEKMW